MNSFTLTAIGNLARDPELTSKGGTTYARFCLIGNDYAGKDEEGAEREIVTSIWFVAFGVLGETIAHHAGRGDQLIVEAQVRADNWIDRHGERRHDYSYVVRGFRIGARGRSGREAPSDGASDGASAGEARGRRAEQPLHESPGASAGGNNIGSTVYES